LVTYRDILLSTPVLNTQVQSKLLGGNAPRLPSNHHIYSYRNDFHPTCPPPLYRVLFSAPVHRYYHMHVHNLSELLFQVALKYDCPDLINAQNLKFKTPLHLACENGNLEWVVLKPWSLIALCNIMWPNFLIIVNLCTHHELYLMDIRTRF